MLPSPSSSPRRTFLQRLAGASAALATMGWSSARAEVPNATTLAADDAFVGRIRGKYRQVFDGVTPADGDAVLFGLNFVDSTTSALNVPASEVTSVVVLRHWAMPLALKDELWAKYKVGEAIKVTDPKTNAPAVRNIFRDNILLHPGITYDSAVADRRVAATRLVRSECAAGAADRTPFRCRGAVGSGAGAPARTQALHGHGGPGLAPLRRVEHGADRRTRR